MRLCGELGQLRCEFGIHARGFADIDLNQDVAGARRDASRTSAGQTQRSAVADTAGDGNRELRWGFGNFACAFAHPARIDHEFAQPVAGVATARDHQVALFVAAIATAFTAVTGHRSFVAGATAAFTMGTFVLPCDGDRTGDPGRRFGFADAHALTNIRPINGCGLGKECPKQIRELRGQFRRQ